MCRGLIPQVVQEGADLARTIGASFIEASAKTSVNVEEAFMDLVRRIRKQQQSDLQKPPAEQKSCAMQ